MAGLISGTKVIIINKREGDKSVPLKESEHPVKGATAGAHSTHSLAGLEGGCFFRTGLSWSRSLYSACDGLLWVYFGSKRRSERT